MGGPRDANVDHVLWKKNKRTFQWLVCDFTRWFQDTMHGLTRWFQYTMHGANVVKYRQSSESSCSVFLLESCAYCATFIVTCFCYWYREQKLALSAEMRKVHHRLGPIVVMLLEPSSRLNVVTRLYQCWPYSGISNANDIQRGWLNCVMGKSRIFGLSKPISQPRLYTTWTRFRHSQRSSEGSPVAERFVASLGIVYVRLLLLSMFLLSCFWTYKSSTPLRTTRGATKRHTACSGRRDTAPFNSYTNCSTNRKLSVHQIHYYVMTR
jgi:hypothetical protein